MSSHSLKRNDSKNYDGNESRLSDDIHSLDSWSESIGHSTHSSSLYLSCDNANGSRSRSRGINSKERVYESDMVGQGKAEAKPRMLANSSYPHGDSRYVWDESPSHNCELNAQSANGSRDAENKIVLSSSVDPVAVTGIRQKSQERKDPRGVTTLQAQNLASDSDAHLNLSTTYHYLPGPASQQETSQIFDYHKNDNTTKSWPLHFRHYFKIKQKSSNDNYVRPSSQSGTFPRNDSLPQREIMSPATFVKHDSRRSDSNVDHITHTRKSSSPRLHVSQPNMSDSTFRNVTFGRQGKSSNDLESLNEASEHRLEPENVKMKMMSMWNNIKYGWTFKSKTNIKYDSPLFLLGKCYHRRRDGDESSNPEEEFMKDFASRIWLTYRRNFYPIPGTKLCTDCGWGCMLRSSQMLIAQCLITHFLGRDWRVYNEQTETDRTFYRNILRWFSDPVDTPSDKFPFCLHNLVNIGRSYNKNPGEWFGPASVAYIFRDAFTRASHSITVLNRLCLYVAQDCTVYIEDIIHLCTAREKSESISGSFDQGTSLQVLEEESHAAHSSQSDQPWERSLILLIPMRLGGEVMNDIYTPCVRSLLSQSNCMGIIGGKPKHSLYFIGWQDDKLIYLDPHFCRDAVDTSDKDFKIESFHCMFPRSIVINKMDPSCTVGFYIKNSADFHKFVQEVQEFIAPPKQRGTYPLFIFEKGTHLAASAQHGHHGMEKGRVKVTHYHIDENGQRQRSVTRESEDFIML